MKQHIGVGRRKRATARCYLKAGKGQIQINHRDPKEYFCDLWQLEHAFEPLETAGVSKDYDVKVNVSGRSTGSPRQEKDSSSPRDRITAHSMYIVRSIHTAGGDKPRCFHMNMEMGSIKPAGG
jgi:hypothetical protein